MIITAPNYQFNFKNRSVFLAGTIDNGNSVDWQSETAERLLEQFPRLDIYNPRRNNWDANADSVQVIGQIQWELEYLHKVDIVFFNFLEGSASPVTMLELGIVLPSTNCVVVNPRKFYRHENIQQTCLFYNRLTHSTYQSGYAKLVSKIDTLYN